MNGETKSRDVVLVVDDSPDTLRLLTDALDGAGMTVMVALDGAAAIRICEQITPDVILLDAVMQGIDGFETCRRLKLDPDMGSVPVIFMTGLTETDDVVRGFAAGGVDYVTKPIVVEEMLARIRVHLANARLTQSARAALDASGRFLFAVNREGEVVWATPQAKKLLVGELPATSVGPLKAPALWLQWLEQVQSGTEAAKMPSVSPGLGADQLRLQYMGRLNPNEFLLRLARRSSADTPAAFSRDLGLTSREGEVLSWLSKGKSNRDIAQILGLSPRTVDKHLEQVYAKLGVENRTAAAAIAAQIGARQRRVSMARMLKAGPFGQIPSRPYPQRRYRPLACSARQRPGATAALQRRPARGELTFRIFNEFRSLGGYGSSCQLPGGGRSPWRPVCRTGFPANREKNRDFL